jgi:hypothetical protein
LDGEALGSFDLNDFAWPDRTTPLFFCSFCCGALMELYSQPDEHIGGYYSMRYNGTPERQEKIP